MTSSSLPAASSFHWCAATGSLAHTEMAEFTVGLMYLSAPRVTKANLLR